jgi:type IV secretory pathway component VirB8
MREVNTPIAPYQQSVANNRILVKMVIMLSLIILPLIFCIVFLVLRSEREFVVIEYKDSSNNFVRIAKAGEDYTRNEILIRATLRNYVNDREQIDHITEEERYARVMAMSCGSVGDTFKTVYGGPKALINKEGFIREIDIKSDSIISYGKHQIEFTTVDYQEDEPDKKSISGWIATISYSFESQQVSDDIGLLNPTGICIPQYRLSKKKI